MKEISSADSQLFGHELFDDIPENKTETHQGERIKAWMKDSLMTKGLL